MMMPTSTRCVALLLLATTATVQAFQPSISKSNTAVRSNTVQLAASSNQERRAFLTAGAAAAASLMLSSPAFAADEPLEEVYFGCGCFWHVQHEFVEAEKKILGRSDDELTARAGYAGGKLGRGKDGKVCYHNGAGASDYGKLGHGEVVSIKIPASKFQEFAVEYCKLFKDGMRPDQAGDRGLEYRNLVAFKGGSKSPLAQQLIEASKATGDQLGFGAGKGSDADVPKLVWIMDIDEFPFYVGEAYHQFHDGFAFGENYPKEYNALAQKYVKKGEDFGTCPG
jgi:peptide methionine sulfoxide reductase MsrA